MLVIRLQRTGRKNSPAYRIVVAEKAEAVKGRYQEIVGHYLPTREPVELTFDQDRISHWVGLGARPSDTVARILSKNGMKDLEKFIERYAKRRSKNAPPEEPTPPPPPAAKAPEAEAAPKEEAKAEVAAAPEAPAEEPKVEEKAAEQPSEPEESKNEGDTESKAS